MYKKEHWCIKMFTESEIDEKTDFVPKQFWNNDFWRFCKKFCRNYETCPCLYQCPTITRWDNADLDDDYSN